MRRYSRTVNNVSASNQIPLEKASLSAASSVAALLEVEILPLPFASQGGHSSRSRTQTVLSRAYTMKPPRIEVYIAYADADKRYFKKIKERLEILRRQGKPISCHECEISRGTAWQRNDHLATAHLILLLVSDTFLNSDFCYSDQLCAAVERHRSRDLCYIIPIKLHPMIPDLLSDTPFGHLGFLPTNDKPISAWKDPHEAYNDITRHLLDKINELDNYLP